MQKQTEKIILDATAGFRMMWFNKHHPNAIYLDERAECKPDIIGDFRKLQQFQDEEFRLIVFDPPHVIKHNINGHIQHHFGVLQPETWQSDVKRGLTECLRVLKPYGVLIFKWSETDKPLKQILPLLPQEPLFAQRSSGAISRSGKPSSTFWFCFMKIPSVGGIEKK